MLCVLIRIASSSDFNEYTQYTIFNIKKKITLNYPKSAATGFCSKGLKKEFETAVVNEPSVFEPLKFYYTMSPRFSLKGKCANCSSSGLAHKSRFNVSNPGPGSKQSL